MTERYQSVNGAWPDIIPDLTPQEAISAGRRLYRFGFGRAFKGKIKIASGNRYNTIRRGVMYVNPRGHGWNANGWRDLIHDLSHYVHRRKWPSHRPRGPEGTHAYIERSMIQHVVSSGWLDGKLRRPEKAPATKRDLQELRQVRVLAGIKRWEAKRRRAERAIKKLRLRARYYEKALAA